MRKLIEKMKSLVRDDEGATMVEYGIMVGLIAVVSILIITQLGDKVGELFNVTQENLDPVTPATPR